MKKLFGSNGTMIRTFFIVGIILMLAAQSLVAATIKGKVSDKETNDGLAAANVLIKGTSLGTAANLEGNYVINNVPPGMYTLVVTYIGYVTVEAEVEVHGSGTVEKNVALSAEAVEGTEVVTVTAQAAGQIEAINQQISSNTITNIVSSAKIHELPDADAATALSRLPGLSLMNGDQIVIRGIEAKQNLVLVNGIQLPSTDVNTRATNLGFFSANMLSGIEVTKVVTPDMDANTIGGVVNLRLREAPSGLHFDVMSQGGLNHQERSFNNYKFWASVSNRYFNDKLGVFLQGNADRSDGGQDRTDATYELYEAMPYGEAPYRMNALTFKDQQNVISSYGGSLIMDYKLPQGKIMLQNTISFGENDNASHNFEVNLQNNRLIYSLNRDKYDRKLISNALQTEYNFGALKTNLTLSHSYSDRSTAIRYGDAGDNTNFTNSSNAVFGVDENGNPISYADLRNTITPKDVYDLPYDTDDYLGARASDWTVIRDVAFHQHIYNTQLDFSLPVSFTDNLTSTFKFGGKFIRTTRENDLDRWYKRSGDEDFYSNVRYFIPGDTLTNENRLKFTDIMDTDYDRGKYYLDGKYDFNYGFNVDMLDDFYTKARDGWGQAVHKQGTVQDDFHGEEIFTAGYLMGTFNIGPKLTLIGGGRFEHYNMDYKASNFYCTHPVDGNGRLMDTLNTAERNDDQFFPNAQARYKFTDWADLRLAYSQTVSRPDYRAILPRTIFSPGSPQTTSGNPKLNPAISKNLDAFMSFYSNKVGLFTIGGFYKRIEDVFFQTNIVYQNLSYYTSNFPDDTFWYSQYTVVNGDTSRIPPPVASEVITTYLNNPNPAYVKGLEFDWQTTFWYLPIPWNSLVLNVNYTRVSSEMDYQQLRNLPIDTTYIDPITHRKMTKIIGYSTIDTIRTARLLNQGNDVVNVALGYDYKGFSGRISFNMQGNVITSVGTRPEEDQFTGNIYKWDFTLKQKLPIEGLSVSLSGVNIFHNPTKTYRKFRRVIDGPVSDYELSTAYNPRRFLFNLRYTM